MIEKFISCNLWSFLPSEKRSKSLQNAARAGQIEHERLKNEEFKDHEVECRTCFDYVKQRCVRIHKEQTLEMEVLEETLAGTPDLFGFEKEEETLHIIDYKTGNSFVSADHNKQLLAYALLIYHNFPEYRFKKIRLYILNTLHDHVSKFTYQGTSYMHDLEVKMEEAIERNRSRALYARSGSHCTYCPAKRYCPLNRSYRDLKNYADMDSDELILIARRRKQEVLDRENAIKSGEEMSEKLSPLVRERVKRKWKEEIEIPERFMVLKPMSLTEAGKEVGYKELEPYLDISVSRFLSCS